MSDVKKRPSKTQSALAIREALDEASIRAEMQAAGLL
jgi:hypothetical protein